MNSEVGQGYSVTVDDRIIWKREVVECPTCGLDHGHTMSAYTVDTETAFTCSGNHLWFRSDIPGAFVAAVAERIEKDPDAMVYHIDLDDMEGKES